MARASMACSQHGRGDSAFAVRSAYTASWYHNDGTMMAELKKGDVVALKSGGPRMTVSAISGESIKCNWFDNTELREGGFDAATLDLYVLPTGRLATKAA